MLTDAVHHVSLCVRDLDASLAFYCDLLGLEKIDRPDFGIPGAWLDAGNAQIHLIVAPDHVDTGRPPEKLSPLANHTSFAIHDYQATVDHLKSHGLEVLETSAEIGQLWVPDPSGHVIEFTVRR
jgi:catechol 2,3-dioxygenase-like lactoylglutathione lyase family enzyme